MRGAFSNAGAGPALAILLQDVLREKQERIARNQQPPVVQIDQTERGADVRKVPERHEHPDQREDEDYEAKQTGFTTGCFHVFSRSSSRFDIPTRAASCCRNNKAAYTWRRLASISMIFASSRR